MNNKSIQILRGTRANIAKHKDEELLDGQLIYNLTDNSLAVGGGLNGNLISKDPITVRELKGNIDKFKIDTTEYDYQIKYKEGVGLTFINNVETPNGLVPSAEQKGIQSFAFGGKRYDKLKDEKRTPTSAEGNQSFAAGGSNHTYGDWDIAMGADNTAYQRNAISLGKGNQSGMTFEEYQALPLYSTATEDEWKKYYVWATAIGVSNKVVGQGGVGLGTSNEVYDKAGIGIGHTNIVSGAASVGIGRNNKISHNLSYTIGDGNNTDSQSILIGWNNTSGNNYDIVLGLHNSIKGTVIGGNNTGDGSGTVIGDGNILNGSEDYIIGKNNSINGSKQSITFGHDNTSQSGYGVTFGAYNTNKGNYNLVGGGGEGSGPNNNIIDNISNSIMYGTGLNKVGGLPSAIFGRYNTKNRIDAIFEVGNGTSDTKRSNAFEVLKDGRAKVQSAPVDDDDVIRKFELNKLESNIFNKVSKEYLSGGQRVVDLSFYYDRTSYIHPSLKLDISTPKGEHIIISDALQVDQWGIGEPSTYTASKNNVQVDDKVDYDDLFYLRVYGEYDFIFSSISGRYDLTFIPRLKYQLIPKKTILIINSIVAYNYGPSLTPNQTPLSYIDGVLEGGLLLNFDSNSGNKPYYYQTSSIYLMEQYDIYFSNMLI